MFKKNTKPILNPSLPIPQPRGPRGPVPAKLTQSMPASTKAPSITKQLLAKYENKYVNKVKEAKSTESDISDLEPIKGQETVGAEMEFTHLASAVVEEEVNYESDFEASDSDMPDNEKSPTGCRSVSEDENSFLPKNIDEITENSIHENIFTFEELMKNDSNQLNARTIEVISNKPDDISELLENEIEEIIDDINTPEQDFQLLPQQIVHQSKKSEIKSTNEHDNVLTFSELLSKKRDIMTASGNQIELVTQNNDKSSCSKESISFTNTFKEVEVETSKHNNMEDGKSLLVKLNSTKEFNPARQSSVKEEKQEIINKILSSPTKSLSTGHAENMSQEKEQRPKPKSKRKSSQQSLQEKRRMERMFFLMEKQSQKGVVEQPVFSPLAMSWEKEAEATNIASDSQLASPEDAFAEMLRLRLRVTRDKMSAEYAAYRSCCVAAQVLASSHQPVTLAATKQIIAQLKQPDRPESAT